MRASLVGVDRDLGIVDVRRSYRLHHGVGVEKDTKTQQMRSDRARQRNGGPAEFGGLRPTVSPTSGYGISLSELERDGVGCHGDLLPRSVCVEPGRCHASERNCYSRWAPSN